MTIGRQSILALWMLCAVGCSAIVNFDNPRDTERDFASSGPDAGAAPRDGSSLLTDAQAPADATTVRWDATLSVPDAALPISDAAGPDASEGGGGQKPDAATAPDAAVHCSPLDHAGCGPTQLCCDRGDGQGPLCRETSETECAACGQPCNDPNAPACGARSCECEVGTGAACAAGTLCSRLGSEPRCVECETDDDCSAHPRGGQCVDNHCRECDPGTRPDAADDEGCDTPARPICGPQLTCQECSRSPNNCPGDQVCAGNLGCVGCDPSAGRDRVNCGGTRPICRIAGQSTQCSACRSDSECGSGYCDNRPGVGSGACTDVCAPAAPIGANGCPHNVPYDAHPFCKQRSGGDYACVGCSHSDCGGARPYCADGPGPSHGQCVGCRGDRDCNGGVCDLQTPRWCRDRAPRDCASGLFFEPQTQRCVQCLMDDHCGFGSTPAYCGPENTCVECDEDADCEDPDRPLCRTSTHTCVGCNGDVTNADSRCNQKMAGTVCVTQPGIARAGSCGPCDPARDVQQTERSVGCSDDLSRCAAMGSELPRCHECDPNDRYTTCPSGRCQRRDALYECVPEDQDSTGADGRN